MAWGRMGEGADPRPGRGRAQVAQERKRSRKIIGLAKLSTVLPIARSIYGEKTATSAPNGSIKSKADSGNGGTGSERELPNSNRAGGLRCSKLSSISRDARGHRPRAIPLKGEVSA